jgi:hypothetical protein
MLKIKISKENSVFFDILTLKMGKMFPRKVYNKGTYAAKQHRTAKTSVTTDTAQSGA